MQNHRVLVVETEEPVAELLATLLQARGCIVETVSSAALALPLLLTRDYDLVMCDIRLPGLDGRSLYDQVLSERPEMARRFLICTGDTVSMETSAFIRSKGLPVLTKPFHREDLFAAVLPFLHRFTNR